MFTNKDPSRNDGIEIARLREQTIGYYVLCAVVLSFGAFAVRNGYMTTVYALVSALFAFNCGANVVRYYYTKNTAYMIAVAFWGFLSLSQGYNFVAAVLGW